MKEESAQQREQRLLEEESDMAVEELSLEGLGRRAREAARDGRPWELQQCLELGADVSATGWDGGPSLLALAARSRSAASARLVQERLRGRGLPSCSAQAVEEASPGWPGSAETLSALLEGNAGDASPLGARESGALRALERALDYGAVDSVFAVAKAAPEAMGMELRGGLVALSLAAGRDEPECVKALLAAGADPSGCGEGPRPLMLAAAMSSESARLLLEAGADPLERDGLGMSALMAAACMMNHEGNGNLGSLALLLPVSERGARDKEGRTALMWALKAGAGDCADALWEAGMELSLPGEEEEAMAALRGHGREDWAARVERERLERETAARAARPRARL